MERVQATSRPCHYNRFPIRFVRRPPPSGTPPGLEQKCQPQTALMNWRCRRRWPIPLALTSPFLLVDHGNANLVSIDACTLGNDETYPGFALPIGAFTGTEDETVLFLSCSPSSPHGPAIEDPGKRYERTS